jgi:hypothetical protein
MRQAQMELLKWHSSDEAWQVDGKGGGSNSMLRVVY